MATRKANTTIQRNTDTDVLVAKNETVVRLHARIDSLEKVVHKLDNAVNGDGVNKGLSHIVPMVDQKLEAINKVVQYQFLFTGTVLTTVTATLIIVMIQKGIFK